MAGGWTGKLNRKISREKHAGCVLHLQLSYSVMEIWLFGVLVLSSLAKCWEISTHWKMAKKIMESERLIFFFFWSALGWMTCIYLQETIKNNKDCTLLMDSAEVPFLHSCLKCSFTSEKHFDFSLSATKGARNVLSGSCVAWNITFFGFNIWIQLYHETEKWLRGAVSVSVKDNCSLDAGYGIFTVATTVIIQVPQSWGIICFWKPFQRFSIN